MLCKNNESGMRECDKFWKAKSEIQNTWDKKYILKYKPDAGAHHPERSTLIQCL